MIDTVVMIGCYALILLGLWLVFNKSIFYAFGFIKPNRPFRKEFYIERKSSFYSHIEKLLIVVKGNSDRVEISSFFFICIFLFMIAMVVVIQRTTLLKAIAFSLAISISPYVWLRLQLNKIRIDSSYEADKLINELINQYKLNNNNMIDAIDETIHNIKEAPSMKRQLFILSLKLKEYRTKEQLKASIEHFIYAVETEWIILLANNIYISITENIDITLGLEDIQKEIKQAIADKEREKRLNLESISIVKYLTPTIYLLSILLSKKVFNIPIKDFFEYQLNTSTGFNYFMIIVVITLFNNSLIVLLNRQKFDI